MYIVPTTCRPAPTFRSRRISIPTSKSPAPSPFSGSRRSQISRPASLRRRASFSLWRTRVGGLEIRLAPALMPALGKQRLCPFHLLHALFRLRVNRLRDLRQQLVGLLFFFKRLAQQRGDIVPVHLLGNRSGG